MRIHQIQQTQMLPISLGEAWAFFSVPANLNVITPPDMGFKPLGGDPGMLQEGQLFWYRVQITPFFHRTWVTEITYVRPMECFVDEQRFGPYKLWRHRHSFRDMGDLAVEITDTVTYALPLWPLGELAHDLYVRPLLEKVFNYRRQALQRRFGD